MDNIEILNVGLVSPAGIREVLSAAAAASAGKTRFPGKTAMGGPPALCDLSEARVLAR